MLNEKSIHETWFEELKQKDNDGHHEINKWAWLMYEARG